MQFESPKLLSELAVSSYLPQMLVSESRSRSKVYFSFSSIVVNYTFWNRLTIRDNVDNN